MTTEQDTAKLEDMIDCLQRSVANIRKDVNDVLDEKLDKFTLEILTEIDRYVKDEQARRRERGY